MPRISDAVTVPIHIELASRRNLVLGLLDFPHLDATADQRQKRWVLLRPVLCVYPLVPEITDSWGKPEAEQRTGGEHLIGKAGRVGVMLPNPQIRVVPEQTIKDVCQRSSDNVFFWTLVALGDIIRAAGAVIYPIINRRCSVT